MRKQVYWFFSFAFLAAGLAIAAYGFMRLHAARSSPGWPSVEGFITSSINEEVYTVDGGYFYKPRVEFEYEIEGREYQSDNLTFGRTKFPDEEFVDYMIRQYPVGGVVTVFYSPRNPARAVLASGDSSGLGVIAGMGVLIAILSFFPIVRGLRYDPRRP